MRTRLSKQTLHAVFSILAMGALAMVTSACGDDDAVPGDASTGMDAGDRDGGPGTDGGPVSDSGPGPDGGPAADGGPPVMLEEYGGTGASYYIATTGNDSTGDGSMANPWRTLSHACQEVTTSGDIIHVLAGTYAEESQCELALGVSIEGEGDTSVIESHLTAAWTPTVSLVSSTAGTAGNQHISRLRFDGNGETAWGGVYVAGRSRVSVHDCSFVDFHDTACIFNGKTMMYEPGPPAAYCTDNRFYSNVVTNCSFWDRGKNNYATGALHIGAQENMVIFDNVMTENSRGDGLCGYNIKYYNEGYLRGLRIFGNTIVKRSAGYVGSGQDWNFAIELWNYRGGVEIYDNTIEGSIDTDHAQTGSYDFAIDIHDNVFGYSTLPPQAPARNNGGVFVEYGMEGPFYIRNNLFRNLGTPIQIYPRAEHIADLQIYNNVFSGLGASDDGSGEALLAGFAEAGASAGNISFIHNTAYVGSGGATYGVVLENLGTVANLRVQNNIFQGFTSYAVYSNLSGTSSIGNFWGEHNVLFGNGTNEITHLGAMPAVVTAAPSITGNPSFVAPGSDYHLLAGSSAVNAGVHVDTVLVDRDGVARGNPPEIGAYEN